MTSAPPSLSRRRLVRSPFPRVAGRLLRVLAHRRMRRWEQALQQVEQVQTAQLLRFTRHAATTEFGRRHGFARIRSHADFAAAVPVHDYDAFVPAFERMMRGERNILVPEFIRYWGNSSGSSQAGRQKFLPVSERQIRYQKRTGFDVLARFLVNTPSCTDFLSGFTLGLFPPPKFKPTEQVIVTNNPGLMSTRVPRVLRSIYLPREEIKAIEDYDAKLTKIAEAYVDYDVRAISGTTCWFSVIFDKLLAAARRLGRPAETVRDIWPNLTVLLGGGVSADPYRPVIRDRVGGDIYLVDTYNATEGGLYATTDAPGVEGMLMIPDGGVFFEFVPLEEAEAEQPTRVPLWQVEPGRPYVILVTTPSGLYAYKLGDIVQFPSVDPLRIEFAGRLSGNLSTTQELTTHVEIEKSVRAAIERHPCGTVDFAAGAEVGVGGTAKARYLLFVEFVDGEEPADLEGFLAAFDAKLCEINRVYREHRDGEVAILPPKLYRLPAGSVRRYLDEAGQHNVQSKFPRIVNDARRDILLRYCGQ